MDAGADTSADTTLAEHLATLNADEDDEDAAVKEALGQLACGKGRPLSEYAEEFNARFAARYGPA